MESEDTIAMRWMEICASESPIHRFAIKQRLAIPKTWRDLHRMYVHGGAICLRNQKADSFKRLQ